MTQNTISTNQTAINYRPDIDGLRAIAVCSVVLFHGFPSLIPGGFVGVDIFFVISGYLITLIIQKDIESSKFGFANFYLKRISRLYPALGLVLLSSLTAAWFLFMPLELEMLGKHLASAAAFIANLIFWSEAGYFEVEAIVKPLLHLWSLGVEEQFYILWPAILLLAHRLKLPLISIIIALCIASFIHSFVLSGTDATQAFFSPFSRAWQLGVGALLAVAPARTNMRFANMMSAVGLLLICVAFVVTTKTSFFPGYLAILPVLGAALVIRSESALNNALLSSKPIVAIGLISYPLYLWHWPILSFPTIIFGSLPWYMRLGTIMASLILAILTYLFVEKPIRQSRQLASKALFLFLFIGTIGICGGTIFYADGLPNRTAITQYVDVEAKVSEQTTWPYAENQNCLTRFPSEYRKEGWWFCVLEKNEAPTIFLIGNSYANHLYPGITSHPALEKENILQFGACDPAVGLTFSAYGPSHPCFNTGRQRQEEMTSKIIRDNPTIHTAILSAIWPSFNESGEAVRYYNLNEKGGVYRTLESSPPGETSFQAYMQGLERRIVELLEQDITTILSLTTPGLGYSPTTCIRSRPLVTSQAECIVPLSIEQARQASFRRAIFDLKTKYPSLLIYDPLPTFCNASDCKLSLNNTLLLRDLGHLSVSGSELYARDFLKWFKSNTLQ